ncbi:TPA: hypothetical protein OT849_001215 [Enterobacter cloacae]|nr:hypothetical protein [Enterobacter cloacae]HCT7897254.1 hypothetical protein [Enterobacter cloacae]HEG2204991.1 hypothetical protein [Enterobacter cloacae]
MIQFISGQFVGKCFRHRAGNTGLDLDFQQLLWDLRPARRCNRATSGDQRQRVILRN